MNMDDHEQVHKLIKSALNLLQGYEANFESFAAITEVEDHEHIQSAFGFKHGKHVYTVTISQES